MAKANASQELEIIKGVLRNFPDGASQSEILKASGLEISWRTLLRRLEILIAQDEVSVTKAGRSTRYGLIKQLTPVSPQSRDILIPLSTASKAIFAQVTKPMEYRTPVGYHQEFHPFKSTAGRNLGGLRTLVACSNP